MTKGSRWLTPDRAVAVLSVIAASLVGLIAISATYDLYGKGPTPPKSLQATYFGSADPLTDLQAKAEFTVTIQSGKEKLSNLRIRQASIQNVGRSPILPEDTYEPLSVRTKAPWRIVSVVDSASDTPNAVHLSWSRTSDQEFQSRPTLFNPGDFAAATVYLTNESREIASSTTKASADPPLAWHVRVANLREISTTPSIDLGKYFLQIGWWVVIIYGWGIIFALASFATYLTLYVFLLSALGWLGESRKSAALIVISGLLSICAAEAGTAYVFEPVALFGGKIDHLANIPVLLTNFAALTILLQLYRRRRRSQPVDVAA